jgi:hypothetical protein
LKLFKQQAEEQDAETDSAYILDLHAKHTTIAEE